MNARAGGQIRLVILDRDGVVNADSDDYIKSPEEFQPYAGSLQAILRLKRAGYIVAIATNQSGIARGFFDEATLQAMHEKLFALLTAAAGEEGDGPWVDHILHCPHGPNEGCECRKPAAGMLLGILKRSGVAADEAIFIGDSLSDIQAARSARIAPRLVRTGKGERTLSRKNESADARSSLEGVPVYTDLPAAIGDLVSISLDDLDG